MAKCHSLTLTLIGLCQLSTPPRYSHMLYYSTMLSSNFLILSQSVFGVILFTSRWTDGKTDRNERVPCSFDDDIVTIIKALK